MKNSSLRWWQRGEGVNKSVVEQIEAQLGVKFPEPYISIVTKYKEAQPEILNEKGEWKTGEIKVKNFGGISFSFLSLSKQKEILKGSSLLNAYNSFKDTLPDSKKIIPFADDGGGNHLYFDFRKDENNPSIVFQDHEEAISAEDLSERDLKKRPLEEWLEMSLIPVANSFEELLENMYPENY